jgi:ABC-type transporter MlaC component
MKTTFDYMTARPRAMALMLVMAFVSAQSLAQTAPNMQVKRVRQEVLDTAKDNKGAGAWHIRWLPEAAAESMV